MIIVLLVLEETEGFNYKVWITPISKVVFSNVLYVNELLVKIALAHYVFLKKKNFQCLEIYCRVDSSCFCFWIDLVQNLQNRLTDQPVSCTAPVLCQPKLLFGLAKYRSSPVHKRTFPCEQTRFSGLGLVPCKQSPRLKSDVCLILCQIIYVFDAKQEARSSIWIQY